MRTPSNFAPYPLEENAEQAREANRRGQLTTAQQARLRFLVEAEQLGTLLSALIALACTLLFACMLSGLLAQHGGAEGAIEFAAIVALGLYFLWNSLRRLRRLGRCKEAVEVGLVTHTDGRVFWKWRHYAAEVPGEGRLRLLVPLRPGGYRFYFVPHATSILSAEPTSSPPEARQALLRVLEHARRFDEADLAANRQQRLAPSQAQRLSRVMALAFWLKAIGAVFAGAVFVSLVVSYQMGRAADYALSGPLAAAPWLIILSVLIYDHQIRLADLRQGRVLHIQGLGSREVGWFARWQIEGQPLSVSKWDDDALVPGVRYRAYLLPRCHYLVSIEPL